MANSTKKKRNVRQFPQPEAQPAATQETATAVLDPMTDQETPFDGPEEPQEPQEAAIPEKPQKTPRTLTFFERVGAISRKEWEGDRAKIKVYRLAPLINRLASSEHKFITVYNSPLTEEQLKIDHGSGKYRLYLNYRSAGSKEAEMDRIELDILDPAFPPKIPGIEWLEDPRNKQWAWARPANAPGNNGTAAPAPVDPLAHLNTFMDIQDRIEDRLRPTDPVADKAPAPVDPWAAAEKILNMRADNPMMAILQEQMKLNAAAAEAERTRAFTAQEAAREREHKLQLQLLEAKNSKAPEKSFVEQLVELATQDKLEPIKKLFFGGNGGGEAMRASRTTYLDVLRDLATGPAGATLAQGIGAFISNFGAHTAAPPPGQYPTVLNAQQSNGTVPPVESPAARIQRIGAAITRPMITAFMRNVEGADFARSMYDMQAEDYTFTRALGAEQIVSMYRRAPEVWTAVQFREADFVEFITAFCAWDPNEDEGPTPGNDGDAGIVDLEKEEAGA